MYRIAFLALIAWAGAALQPALGQRPDFQMVSADALMENPARYWAKSIVFVDRLVRSPGGKTEKFDRIKYVQFKTERLGEVFAHPDVVDELREVEEDTPMIFLGTVYDQKAMFGRTKYFYVVTAYTTKIDPQMRFEALVANMSNPAKRPVDPTLVAITQLVDQAQAQMFSYAAESNIDPSRLFDDDSQESMVASNIARNAVRQLDQGGVLTSSELLTRLVKLIVATRYAISSGETPARIFGDADDEEGPPVREDPLMQEILERSGVDLPIPETEGEFNGMSPDLPPPEEGVPSAPPAEPIRPIPGAPDRVNPTVDPTAGAPGVKIPRDAPPPAEEPAPVTPGGWIWPSEL